MATFQEPDDVLRLRVLEKFYREVRAFYEAEADWVFASLRCPLRGMVMTPDDEFRARSMERARQTMDTTFHAIEQSGLISEQERVITERGGD